MQSSATASITPHPSPQGIEVTPLARRLRNVPWSRLFKWYLAGSWSLITLVSLIQWFTTSKPQVTLISALLRPLTSTIEMEKVVGLGCPGVGLSPLERSPILYPFYGLISLIYHGGCGLTAPIWEVVVIKKATFYSLISETHPTSWIPVLVSSLVGTPGDHPVFFSSVRWCHAATWGVTSSVMIMGAPYGPLLLKWWLMKLASTRTRQVVFQQGVAVVYWGLMDVVYQMGVIWLGWCFPALEAIQPLARVLRPWLWGVVYPFLSRGLNGGDGPALISPAARWVRYHQGVLTSQVGGWSWEVSPPGRTLLDGLAAWLDEAPPRLSPADRVGLWWGVAAMGLVTAHHLIHPAVRWGVHAPGWAGLSPRFLLLRLAVYEVGAVAYAAALMAEWMTLTPRDTGSPTWTQYCTRRPSGVVGPLLVGVVLWMAAR